MNEIETYNWPITPLFFYDTVQLFETTDSAGNHYIGMRAPAHQDAAYEDERFVFNEVFSTDLDDFKAGKIDLLTLITQVYKQPWYLATMTATTPPSLTLEPQHTNIREESTLLPMSGFFLTDEMS